MRRTRWTALALAGFAIMAGALALIGLAYTQQAERVDELEEQNEHILGDHQAIGQKFAQQSKRFEQQAKQVEAAVRSAYQRGFQAGARARDVPQNFGPLTRYAASGMLVPRRIPSPLDPQRARVQAQVDGYAVRWPQLALFASRTEPLSVWTRQALPGLARKLRLGAHRVTRFTGATGVFYAWREKGATYAVVVLPRADAAARALVVSMR